MQGESNPWSGPEFLDISSYPLRSSFSAIADNYYSCYVIYCPEVDMNGKGPKIRPRSP